MDLLTQTQLCELENSKRNMNSKRIREIPWYSPLVSERLINSFAYVSPAASHRDLHIVDSDSDEDYSNYEYLSRSDWVVVQSCSGENEGEEVKQSKFKTQSTLSCRYRIENQWRLLPIESIDEIAHCIVDEYSSDIICIHEKSTWSEKFYEEL